MKRAGYITLTALALAAAVAGLALAFGTPQAPPSPAVVSPPASADAETGVAPPTGGAPDGTGDGGGEGDAPPFGGEIVEGEVPEPDPQSPFAFQIPGCTCHSDDPVVVEEHADYRLNQCRGCHAGSP